MTEPLNHTQATLRCQIPPHNERLLIKIHQQHPLDQQLDAIFNAINNKWGLDSAIVGLNVNNHIIGPNDAAKLRSILMQMAPDTALFDVVKVCDHYDIFQTTPYHHVHTNS